MKVKKQILLLLSAVGITGCTTIGQQITNRDGIIQIRQQCVPSTGQSLSYTNGDPRQSYFYSDKTGLIAIEPVSTTDKIANKTNTNSVISKTNLPVATNSVKNNNKAYETNSVTVNVYTDNVSIEKSSFLSDAFNYFFEE